MSRDLWKQILAFANEHPDDSAIVSFDEDSSAWPCLIDDFVSAQKSEIKKRESGGEEASGGRKKGRGKKRRKKK